MGTKTKFCCDIFNIFRPDLYIKTVCIYVVVVLIQSLNSAFHQYNYILKETFINNPTVLNLIFLNNKLCFWYCTCKYFV